jgi:hypothetical protein
MKRNQTYILVLIGIFLFATLGWALWPTKAPAADQSALGRAGDKVAEAVDNVQDRIQHAKAQTDARAAKWKNYKIQTLDGVVDKVEKGRLVVATELTAQVETNKVTVDIVRDTEYGQIAAISELAPGDSVKIEYVEDKGKTIAVLITKMPGKGPGQKL